MRVLLFALLLVLPVGFVSAIPHMTPVAVAQSGTALPPPPGSIPTEPRTVIENVLNYVLGITGLMAVLFIVIGGFRYITSANNQELIEGAKKTIRYAVVGLLLSILSLVLVNSILRAFLKG